MFLEFSSHYEPLKTGRGQSRKLRIIWSHKMPNQLYRKRGKRSSVKTKLFASLLSDSSKEESTCDPRKFLFEVANGHNVHEQRKVPCDNLVNRHDSTEVANRLKEETLDSQSSPGDYQLHISVVRGASCLAFKRLLNNKCVDLKSSPLPPAHMLSSTPKVHGLFSERRFGDTDELSFINTIPEVVDDGALSTIKEHIKLLRREAGYNGDSVVGDSPLLLQRGSVAVDVLQDHFMDVQQDSSVCASHQLESSHI
uniref:Uncharacterized protein n=1 Tax=Trichuris muris TaxID=70415 RepID=A0A5S6QH64_TRIMR